MLSMIYVAWEIIWIIWWMELIWVQHWCPLWTPRQNRFRSDLHVPILLGSLGPQNSDVWWFLLCFATVNFKAYPYPTWGLLFGICTWCVVVQSQEYIWNHRASIESTRGIKHEKPTSQLEPILPHFVAGNFPVFCLNPMLLLLLLLSSLLLIKWFRCNHHRTNVESAQFWWDNVCCVSLSCQLIHWEGNSHPSSFVELFPLVR